MCYKRSCLCVSAVPDQKWTELDSVQHRAHAMRLLDGLDVIGRERRLKVARAILYMAQGKSQSVIFIYACISVLISSDWCVVRNVRRVLFRSGGAALDEV